MPKLTVKERIEQAGIDGEIKGRRDAIIELLGTDAIKRRSQFYEFPVQIREDRYVFLAAIRKFRDLFKNDSKLKCLPKSLHGDHEVMIECICLNSRAIDCVSPDLLANREFALELVQIDGYFLKYLSGQLRNDSELGRQAIMDNSGAYEFASSELKNDKEFAIRIVKKSGNALQYLSLKLRSDREVVTSAIKNAAHAFQFACDTFRADKEMLKMALKMASTDRYDVDKASNVFRFASDMLRDDKEMALMAIEKDYEAYEYVSDRLKNDREVAIASLRSVRDDSWLTDRLMKHIPRELREELRYKSFD